LNELHLSDLGGKAYVSEAQKSLVRRASTLEVELEQMEASLSEGTPIDPEYYGRVASHLRRILESLSPGLGRVARDASSEIDLTTYATRAYRLADPANADDPAIVDDVKDISSAPAADAPKPYEKNPQGSDEPLDAPRVASPLDGNPLRQAVNASPPAASPSTHSEPAVARTTALLMGIMRPPLRRLFQRSRESSRVPTTARQSRPHHPLNLTV
jgi:hypothetical protein